MKRWSPLAVAVVCALAACTDDKLATAPNPPALDDAVPVTTPFGWAAGPTGAIHTTTPDGGIVNENVRYERKIEVYLSGGPGRNAPIHAAGLDDGDYVFQVTDPSGKVLLSEDASQCRVFRVEDGVIVTLRDKVGSGWVDHDPDPVHDDACHVSDNGANTNPGVAGASGKHDTNFDSDHGEDGEIVVQLMPFFNTPNPGGVYKAWIIRRERYEANGGAAIYGTAPTAVCDRHGRPARCTGGAVQTGYEADPYFRPPETKTDNYKVLEFNPPLITVRKFHDVDADGTWDTGEPEIGVDQCVDVTGAIVACPGGWPYSFTEPLAGGGTQTNGSFTPGSHVIGTGLAGTYTTVEEVLTGWAQSARFLDGVKLSPISPTVNITVAGTSGETHEVVYGNYRPIALSGTKFIDLDMDGVKDAGEGCPAAPDPNNPGCEGVTVRLTGTANLGNAAVNVTTTTDANGDYAFTNVKPGSYTITIDEPAGFSCSFPSPCNYTLNGLISGDSRADLDFGDWRPGTKSGYKFHDLDADRTWDIAEPGLNGWTIRAFADANEDGTADGPAVASTTTANHPQTNAPGYYELSLDPGSYIVVEDCSDQTGWIQSKPTPTAQSTAACGSGKYTVYDLLSGQVHADNNFGNYQDAQLTGVKFADVDGDGLPREAGESGIAGFVIHLFGTTGFGTAYHDHKTTGANGAFSFTGVPPGLYYLCETQQEGFVQRFPTLGPPATPNAIDCATLTHTPTLSGIGYDVTLTSGLNIGTGFDFGNEPTAGCTPGFWQGGNGNVLWNTLNDPDWPARGGNGTNPFAHGTTFGNGPWDDAKEAWLNNLTMLEVVGSGGTEDQARKAGRSLIAAYLNSSFGIAYPYSPSTLVEMWNTANAGGGPSRLQRLLDLHTLLDRANNRGCTIPGTPIF